MSRAPRPSEALPSPPKERTAPERPLVQPAAGRSPFPGEDRYAAAIARLRELGCTGRGPNWTCPRHGGTKRSLRVTRARHPGAVLLHCHVCDAQRDGPSLVLETLEWEPRDLFPPSSRERDPHRAVRRSFHVTGSKDGSMGGGSDRDAPGAL